MKVAASLGVCLLMLPLGLLEKLLELNTEAVVIGFSHGAFPHT